MILLLVGVASGMIGKQFFDSVEISTFFWGLLLLPLQSLVILINAALRGLKKLSSGKFLIYGLRLGFSLSSF